MGTAARRKRREGRGVRRRRERINTISTHGYMYRGADEQFPAEIAAHYAAEKGSSGFTH